MNHKVEYGQKKYQLYTAITLLAEGEEELKILLMKVKNESESWLKTQDSEN